MNHSRGALTAPIARKRKEREDFFTHTINGSGNARVKTAHPYQSQKKLSEAPVTSNRLLAGYLAHEFLTREGLPGHAFDPARAEAVPFSSPTELMKEPDPSLAAGRISVGSSAAFGAKPTSLPPTRKKSYAEVARILKGDGAHIPGIVNPTQLARWIQM